MKRIKEAYLLFVIVIGLFSLSIYSTYALFTKEYRVGMLDINSTTYNINLNDVIEYKHIETYSNQNLNITLNILNPSNDSRYYGIYTGYLDECVSVIHDNDSANIRDIINNGISKSISIEVANTCSYNYSFNLYILTSDSSFDKKDTIDDKYVIKDKYDDSVEENNINVEEVNDNRLLRIINDLYESDLKEEISIGDGTFSYGTMTSLMKDNNNNIRYYGVNPNNYLIFDDELWRIIGVFKENENLVKIIKNDSVDGFIYSDIGNNFKNSNIMKSINPNFSESNIYWNLLDDKYTSMLVKNNYYLGSISSDDINGINLYSSERDTNIIWNGYLGLMYSSDYAYSRDIRTCTSVLDVCDSYLNSDSLEYTISSIKDTNDKVFTISNKGNYDTLSNNYLSIRPVGYLNSNAIVTNGNGTIDNPYNIDLK